MFPIKNNCVKTMKYQILVTIYIKCRYKTYCVWKFINLEAHIIDLKNNAEKICMEKE